MKSISQVCLALLLTFSILAPAIMEAVDIDFDLEISQNIGEEESEKEGKNSLEEVEEKKLIVSSLDFGEPLKGINEIKNCFYYQEKTLELSTSIILPPPEQV